MTAATALAIVCPPWCRVPQEEHLEELTSQTAAGDVLHKSAPDAWASLSLVRQADGTPMPDDEPASVALYLREIFPATREDIEGLIRDLRAVEELLPT